MRTKLSSGNSKHKEVNWRSLVLSQNTRAVACVLCSAQIFLNYCLTQGSLLGACDGYVNVESHIELSHGVNKPLPIAHDHG
jgi:hypothetical protein